MYDRQPKFVDDPGSWVVTLTSTGSSDPAGDRIVPSTTSSIAASTAASATVSKTFSKPSGNLPSFTSRATR